LEGLHLATQLRIETRDEATKEKQQSETNDTVGQPFKLDQIVIDRAVLMKLEECAMRIVIK